MKEHTAIVEVLWTSGDFPADPDNRVLIKVITQKALKEGQATDWLVPYLRPLKESKLFEGNVNQTYILPIHEKAQAETVILVGAGEHPFRAEELRLVAASAARAALSIQAEQVMFEVPASLGSYTVEGSNKAAAHALTEGFLLGGYQRVAYKRDTGNYKGVKKLHFFHEGQPVGDERKEWEEGIHTGRAYAAGTVYARDLTNLPGNYLKPKQLADAATELASHYGFEIEVLNEAEIHEKGMGGITAVGQGSANPPRLITIKYRGRDKWDGEIIGLAGKGITFDTGGISLKRAFGMEDMISDMGGAASVLGVLDILGRLRPKVNVVAVIPAAENMPSGSAMKPGDIITTRSGRTIEMQNADAEGRLILAEAITYAKEQGAEMLIDIATLTGAVVSALGEIATGAVTNDETFLQRIILASKQTAEKIWPLPAYPEYWSMLGSSVADLQNRPGKDAAAITAGLFIGTFAEGMPWIHLDIAGTAYLSKARGVDPKGATGVMVRTLAHWMIMAPPGI